MQAFVCRLSRPGRSSLQRRPWRASSGLLAAVALLATPVARSDEPAPWTVVGTQGLVQIVIVPKDQARDREAYQRQVARLCPPERTCFVNFYENPTGEKVELPLSDAIAHAATARFRRSMKNGEELFQWSCRMGDSATEAQCF